MMLSDQQLATRHLRGTGKQGKMAETQTAEIKEKVDREGARGQGFGAGGGWVCLQESRLLYPREKQQG